MAYNKSIALLDKIRNEELIERSKHYIDDEAYNNRKNMYNGLKERAVNAATFDDYQATIDTDSLERRFPFPQSASKEYLAQHAKDVDELSTLFTAEHEDLTTKLPAEEAELFTLIQKANSNIAKIKAKLLNDSKDLVSTLAQQQRDEDYLYSSSNMALGTDVNEGIGAYVATGLATNPNQLKEVFGLQHYDTITNDQSIKQFLDNALKEVK